MIVKVQKQERKNPLNLIRLERNTCIDVMILKSLPTKKPKTNKETNKKPKQNKSKNKTKQKT